MERKETAGYLPLLLERGEGEPFAVFAGITRKKSKLRRDAIGHHATPVGALENVNLRWLQRFRACGAAGKSLFNDRPGAP